MTRIGPVALYGLLFTIVMLFFEFLVFVGLVIKLQLVEFVLVEVFKLLVFGNLFPTPRGLLGPHLL